MSLLFHALARRTDDLPPARLAGAAPSPGRPPIRELTLVLPAYNEAAGIAGVLAEYHATLARFCRRFEILVVDDGSTDATPLRLAEARRKMPELTVLTQPRNSGYAAALGRGLLAARYDPVLYTDADGQFDLADLGAAYRLLGDDVELVAGYREVRADPLPRRVAAAGFNALVRLLLGVRARDVDCAFKLFRRRFFDRVQLASDGFLIDTEIFARAERARLGIVQLPVRHRPRRAGRSTVRLRTVWTSWRQLLALRRRLRSEERLATRTHAERFV